MSTIQHTKNNSFSSSIAYISDRNVLNNVCLLTPYRYKIVKRNKSLKNPRNRNVSNDRFSIFMPPIKCISSHWLQFPIIYLVH